MKSSIKIDFIDRGTGKGIEPVIRVEIINSEDPRDTLVSHLFQSLQGQSYLQLHYSYHQQDGEKTALLFKPEVNTDKLMSVVRMTFYNWLMEEKYVVSSVGKHEETTYVLGDKYFSESELFKDFLSIKAIHSTG